MTIVAHVQDKTRGIFNIATEVLLILMVQLGLVGSRLQKGRDRDKNITRENSV